jgi:hypothetical protein
MRQETFPTGLLNLRCGTSLRYSNRTLLVDFPGLVFPYFLDLVLLCIRLILQCGSDACDSLSSVDCLTFVINGIIVEVGGEGDALQKHSLVRSLWFQLLYPAMLTGQRGVLSSR